MNEELKEAHEEANRPQSEEEKALNIDLTQSASQIAEDNDRKTIVKVLEINGITFETLNISKSKFNKLNKEQLVKALFEYKDKPTEDKEQKAESVANVDYIALLMQFKDLIQKAHTSGDYSKLDGAVGKEVLNALSNTQGIEQININPVTLSKILLGLATIYFISRMIGFSTIAEKINQIKERFINKQKAKNEQK